MRITRFKLFFLSVAILFFLFLGGGFIQLQGQSGLINFDNYSLKDGLSNSRVRSFCQDKRGFIWVGTASGLNCFDAYDFKVYRHRPGEAYGLQHNSVLALLEDSRGYFWIGTKKGLQLFDWSTDRFYSFDWGGDFGEVLSLIEDSEGAIWVASAKGLYCIVPSSDNDPIGVPVMSERWSVRSFSGVTEAGVMPTGRVWCLKEDMAGRLWIGTNAGLRCYSLEQERFLPLFPPSDLSTLSSAVVHDLEIDRQGELWVGTEEGLFRMAADGESGQVYRGYPGQPGGLQHHFITELELDGAGQLWIGTSGGGLSIWDAATDSFLHAQHQPFEERALPSNHVEAMFVDGRGGVWVGTHDGLSHHHPAAKPFRFFQSTGLAGSIGRGTVQGLCVGADDRVWAGIDGGGLGVYNAGEWRHYRCRGQPPTLPADDVTAVMEDRAGQLWVATWTGGLSIFDPRASSIRSVAQDLLGSKAVWALFEDTHGRIWIGTVNAGPLLYDPVAGTFTSFPAAIEQAGGLGKWVIAFGQDKQGRVWVATDRGLFGYRELEQAFDYFPVPGMESGDFIHALHPGSQGGWWLGTQHGLLHFDPSASTVQKWDETQGLTNDWVLSITEDRRGALWMGTARGLSKFEPQKGTFKRYFALGDLRSLECSRAVAQSVAGEFFFGTTQGLLAFHPDSICTYEEVPPVVFTDFKLFNQSVPLRGSTADTLPVASPLAVDIAATEVISLPHWQHSFSFAFTGLNYLEPEQNTFRYQLEGYQDHWVNTGAQERFAYYTNIPPGRYRFKVMAANHDGIWNKVPAVVEVYIRPPWWHTVWAYLVYVVLLGGLVYVLYCFLRWRWQLRLQLQLEQQEAHRLKALDDFKNRLYTNLTHEFRTPLTVILGLAGQIDQPLGIREMLRRNAKNLLRLVNQLLDLAKLEAGHLQLDLVLLDVVPFVQQLTESLQSYAAGKQINLVARMEVDSLFMDVDEEKLERIISNLLSNAIKFTPEGGAVILHLSEQQGMLLLKVEDNGIGIAADQLPRIFDRFYQVDGTATRAVEGTGLGLALIKELVQLMGGQLSVSSQLGKGSEFTAVLPITREAKPAWVNGARPDATSLGLSATAKVQVVRRQESSSHLPQLLLIEDNEDVAFYIQSCLAGQFAFTQAPNGVLGIAEALEVIPDLIISDVMMPEMDGFEVCDFLKNDERTSHVPIILLTARADVASRISGLRRGADAYLTKPFDSEELLVRLEMLLERQRRLAIWFSKKTLGTAPDAQLQEAIEVEDVFVQKVRGIVEAHYADENFALPALCEQIGMSRSQLFRKMKAVSDISPSAFIRNYRLDKAKDLLKATDYNVSEVAWRVGFKDLGHFSRVYQEVFGERPSTTSK